MRNWLGKRNWFGNRAYATGAVNATDPVQAYRAGRADEHQHIEHDVAARPTKAELDAAYERGRIDERKRHRGSPLIAFVVLIVALVGGGMLYLAARDGSFRAAGAAVDNTVSTSVDKAKAPITTAADKTGDALQAAGQNLKKDAGSSGN